MGISPRKIDDLLNQAALIINRTNQADAEHQRRTEKTDRLRDRAYFDIAWHPFYQRLRRFYQTARDKAYRAVRKKHPKLTNEQMSFVQKTVRLYFSLPKPGNEMREMQRLWIEVKHGEYSVTSAHQKRAYIDRDVSRAIILAFKTLREETRGFVKITVRHIDHRNAMITIYPLMN